jgi:hypothetical protein
MPVLRFNDHIYHLRWKPEWDRLLLRTIKLCRLKNGRVNWKNVVKTGILKKIPVSLETLRMRPSAIHDKRKRQLSNEKSKQYQKLHGHSKDRSGLIKLLPGYKPIHWSNTQNERLLLLAKLHRRGKLTDWKAVKRDPRYKILPEQHWSRLSSRLNRLKRGKLHGTVVVPKKIRREYSRMAKRKLKIIRKKIREFLYSKLEKGI